MLSVTQMLHGYAIVNYVVEHHKKLTVRQMAHHLKMTDKMVIKICIGQSLNYMKAVTTNDKKPKSKIITVDQEFLNRTTVRKEFDPEKLNSFLQKQKSSKYGT